MRRLLKFVALRSHERTLLLGAAMRLIVARPLLSMFGMGRTRRWLLRRNATRIDRNAAEIIAQAVARIAPHLPLQTNCLDRAVALSWLLASRDLAADLRLGVRKNEDASLGAHAWVEHDEVVLLDDSAAHFVPLDRPMLASGER